MKFVTVDNCSGRLAILRGLLRELFPGCTVTEFTDTLLSARYILDNEVDAVLAAAVMRPADGENLRYVIEVNKPQVRVVLLTHPETQNTQGFSITKEQLQTMLR